VTALFRILLFALLAVLPCIVERHDRRVLSGPAGGGDRGTGQGHQAG
jgi:hypothetical protein